MTCPDCDGFGETDRGTCTACQGHGKTLPSKRCMICQRTERPCNCPTRAWRRNMSISIYAWIDDTEHGRATCQP